MRVVPIGGLGNRLRTILSWREVYGPITVVWCRSDAVCRGWWEDVFQPLDGVTFVYGGEGHAHEYRGAHDVMSCGVCPGLEGSDWCKAYRELRPHPWLLGPRFPPPYAAIHARRCDHVEHARAHGHFTSNEELLDWYRSRGRLDMRLYLATDCPDTLAWFREREPDLHFNRTPERVAGYEKRPGQLTSAVADLYACVEAEEFVGSWFSSFSETVEILRSPPARFSEREPMPSTDGDRRVR